MSKVLLLEPIEKTDSQKSLLFSLYNERKETYKISAKKIITYKQHSDFVDNHPYRYWFLVKFKGTYIGTLYITEMNCIGVFLLSKFLYLLEELLNRVTENFEPLPDIPSVREYGFHINVSVHNPSYSQALEKIGAKLMQKTYSLVKNPVKKSEKR